MNVLVTGASRGIGRALADIFAEKGHTVFGVFLRTPITDPRVTAIQADVSDERDVERVFSRIGALDVLVNNAGIALIRQIQDTTADEWDRVMAVNLRSVFLCSRAAARLMLPRKRGLIVNVSSIWGESGASCESAYAASKAGVIGLTKSLDAELSPSGIRVKYAALGAADTDMNAGVDLSGFEVVSARTAAEEVFEIVDKYDDDKYCRELCDSVQDDGYRVSYSDLKTEYGL